MNIACVLDVLLILEWWCPLSCFSAGNRKFSTGMHYFLSSSTLYWWGSTDVAFWIFNQMRIHHHKHIKQCIRIIGSALNPALHSDYLVFREINTVCSSRCSIPWCARCPNLNSSPPGPNGRHFADAIFKCICLNESSCIFIPTSLKFVSKGPSDNNSALVQVMAWLHAGSKLLLEPMLTQFTDAYMRQTRINLLKKSFPLMNYIQ